jgi:hypothetical protein
MHIQVDMTVINDDTDHVTASEESTISWDVMLYSPEEVH